MGLISFWRWIVNRRKPVTIPDALIRPDNRFSGPNGAFYAGVAVHSPHIDRVCYFYKKGETAFYFYQYPRNLEGRLCLYFAGATRRAQGAVQRWPYSRETGRGVREDLLWVLRDKSFPVDHDRCPDHRPKVVFGYRFG